MWRKYVDLSLKCTTKQLVVRIYLDPLGELTALPSFIPGTRAMKVGRKES